MFISDKFYFNGRHSDDMNVSLVTFDSDLFNDYGLNYSETIDVEKNNGDLSHFTSTHGDIEELTLNLMLNDYKDEPMVWSDDITMEVTDWLITDSFVEFVSEDNTDLTYYFKVTKIIKKFTRDKLGYLEVTFQPFSNYAYHNLKKTYSYDNTEGSFTINNISNVNTPYKPIITIKNLSDNLNIITIHNETTSEEPFEIKNLDNNEIVTIDSAMGTVFNDYNENKLLNCNREWLELKRGKNKITVSGNVELTIKCQYPIRL